MLSPGDSSTHGKRGDMGVGDEVKARLLDSFAALLDRGSWDLREVLFPNHRRFGRYPSKSSPVTSKNEEIIAIGGELDLIP
jgi:hypothetical protein